MTEVEISTAVEDLDRLLRSETIRLVYEGKYSPSDVDTAFRKMKKQIEEMKVQHFQDLSEIVRLRRNVEFLIGHDNAE